MSTQGFLNTWPSPRHGDSVKQNIYLSLHCSHALTVCIFKSAPSLFLRPLITCSDCHNLVWIFFHLSVLCSLLFLLLPDCFLMDKLCLLTVPSPPPHRPSLTFHRQTPFCPLSHSLCISMGVRPPRWTQTQVDSSCGGGIYSPVGFLTPNLPTNPQPPRHTQAHLASGGSVSLLALDTCLSLHNIKSSYLIWTVIMS